MGSPQSPRLHPSWACGTISWHPPYTCPRFLYLFALRFWVTIILPSSIIMLTSSCAHRNSSPYPHPTTWPHGPRPSLEFPVEVVALPDLLSQRSVNPSVCAVVIHSSLAFSGAFGHLPSQVCRHPSHLHSQRNCSCFPLLSSQQPDG